MNLYVFSVRDQATDMFGTPMFLVAVGAAVRSFTDEINRVAPDNALSQHPDDYVLYELGSFDTDTGKFDTYVPVQICRGKDVSLNYVEKN